MSGAHGLAEGRGGRHRRRPRGDHGVTALGRQEGRKPGCRGRLTQRVRLAPRSSTQYSGSTWTEPQFLEDCNEDVGLRQPDDSGWSSELQRGAGMAPGHAGEGGPREGSRDWQRASGRQPNRPGFWTRPIPAGSWRERQGPAGEGPGCARPWTRCLLLQGLSFVPLY